MIMYGYRYEKIAVGHYWDPKRSDYIIMIRDAQFNCERSLIKMPPNLLVTFYFAMLVVLPMKVYILT